MSSITLRTVAARHSVRNFDSSTPDLHAIGTRLTFTTHIMPLRPEAIEGRVGTYGVITGRPAYAAVCCRPAEMCAAGIEGEHLVLQLTALGYGTCWLGGTFSRGKAAAALPRPLADDEKIVAVIAIGHPADHVSFMGRLMKKMVNSSSRKSLTDIIVAGRMPDYLADAMEAARLAPSARNSQPWRYAFNPDGTIDVYCVNAGHFSVLDTGISIANFLAVAPHYKVTPCHNTEDTTLTPVATLSPA